MWRNIEERVIACAEYIVETGCTVRACANYVGSSKSTVHKDMTGRLLHYDSVLFEEVRRVLERNKAERHIRGGLATREKYLILNRAGKK